jgi:opacity protein-like surface antigen
MRKVVFAAVGAALVASAGEAKAQLPIPLSIEGRMDYAVPVRDFDDSVDEGTSWSVGASLGVSPGLGVYGTYSHTEFPIEDVDNADVEDSGWSVGLTTALPRVAGISPWVGAGLLIHQLEVDDSDDGIDEDVGFEVGGGLALQLARNVRLTPGIGYRQYTVEAESLLGSDEFDVTYFTAGIGVNVSF